MILYRIRDSSKHSIEFILNNNIEASIIRCFDDKTEAEWFYNKKLIFDTIDKKLKSKQLTEEEIGRLYMKKPFLKHNQKSFELILDTAANPKTSNFKDSHLVACFSRNNLIDDNKMWDEYTNHNSAKGILLIYDTNSFEGLNGAELLKVKYINTKRELDLSNYWIDFIEAYCKATSITNKKYGLVEKNYANNLMMKKHSKYITEYDLLSSKNINWSYQNEYRLVAKNPNYNPNNPPFIFDKVDELDVDKLPISYKHGTIGAVKPIAIYVRKHVYARYKNKIKYMCNLNKILYFEEGDKVKLVSFLKRYKD